jgi:hypothetical protein
LPTGRFNDADSDLFVAKRMKLHFLKAMTPAASWRKQAWAKCPGDGLPDPPRITQPVLRKQWKTIARFKRKAS